MWVVILLGFVSQIMALAGKIQGKSADYWNMCHPLSCDLDNISYSWG